MAQADSCWTKMQNVCTATEFSCFIPGLIICNVELPTIHVCIHVYIYKYIDIQLHLDFKFGSISCHSQNVPRTLQNEDQIVVRALSERRDWRMGYFDVFILFP